MTHLLDILIVILYLSAVLAFGFYIYKKNKTSSSFTRGGGDIPAWALGMSVFATYISSISFLALPGNAYLGNWGNFVFSLSIPLASVFAVRFFVPWYRKINSDSAYSFLENRFGSWARYYASSCYLLTQIARMGAILYLLALPVHSLTGISVPLIIVCTGLLVMVYSAMGGLKAVVYTDAIQGFVLVAGALACFISLIYSVENHWIGFFDKAYHSGKMNLGSLNFSWEESSLWLILIYGFFINLQNFGADQSYIQRYIGARSDTEAKRTVWIGGLLYVPVSLLFFLIGTALWVYYQEHTGKLPEGIAADKILPFYIVNELPVGLRGLLISAILSAGMSTVSTSINSSATILLTDFYSVNRSVSESQSIRFLRLSSVVMAIVSILAGFMFLGVESALDIWWALASILSGGTLGLVLLGIFTRVKKSKTQILAVGSGLLFIVLATLSQTLPGWPVKISVHANFVIIISTLLILISGTLGYALFSRTK